MPKEHLSDKERSHRVNLRCTVNNTDIRRETYNGREHIVVPSYTLPDGVVMNGGLYPREEIDAAINTIEGTLAPLGHPVLDGEYVSASRPEAINAHHVGAFNRNVQRRGNRVYVEKWVDVEFAKNTEGGRKLLEAIEKGEPVHTSTGVFLRREMAPNADGYEWVARDMHIDHDAILINQTGAATPDQGVGMMVNVSDAVPVVESKEGLVSAIVNFLQELCAGDRQKKTKDIQTNEANEMTDEEKAALAANIAEQVTASMAPRIEALEQDNAQLREQLTANTRAAEAGKRALVAEKLGQVVADALTGNALDEAYTKLQTAAPLLPGFVGNRKDGDDGLDQPAK